MQDSPQNPRNPQNPKSPASMKLYQGDLPSHVKIVGSVAVDCETMGLKSGRDRLCLVQLCDEGRRCYLVQIAPGQKTAPNLKKLLEKKNTLKIFHFARFDLTALKSCLGINCEPIYCTRTASKLARTYSDRHGLRDLCAELLKIDLDKQKQSSDWGAEKLSQSQLAYAYSDVLHLHNLMAILNERLEREGRDGLAKACFSFIPTRSRLDMAGWDDSDIFAH